MRNEPAAAIRKSRADGLRGFEQRHHLNMPESLARRPYPSDLSDGQWERVHRLLTGSSTASRLNLDLMRDVADAVNYRWSTGCSWRMLPHDFPEWTRVYGHFRRWRERGLLAAVREVVIARKPVSPAASRSLPSPLLAD